MSLTVLCSRNTPAASSQPQNENLTPPNCGSVATTAGCVPRMISASVGGGRHSTLLWTDGSGLVCVLLTGGSALFACWVSFSLLLTDGSDLFARSVSFFSGFFLACAISCCSPLISSFWRSSCFCNSSLCRSRRSIVSVSDGVSAAAESQVSRQLATSAPPIKPCLTSAAPAETPSPRPPGRLKPGASCECRKE